MLEQITDLVLGRTDTMLNLTDILQLLVYVYSVQYTEHMFRYIVYVYSVQYTEHMLGS